MAPATKPETPIARADRLNELSARATPGPWIHEGGRMFRCRPGGDCVPARTQDDAVWMVETRTLSVALAADVHQLAARVDDLEHVIASANPIGWAMRDDQIENADRWQKEAEAVLSMHRRPSLLEQNEKLQQAHDGLARELRKAIEERDEAREWVRKMHSERQTLTCVYCGHAYPPGTPASGSEALTAHIRTCEKHPMRQLVAENERLREQARRVATLEAEQADAQGAIEGLERQNQQLGLQLQQLRDQHGEERCCSRSMWEHLQGVNTSVRLKMERLDFALRNLPRYCAGRDGAMGADDGDLLDRAEVIAACDEACKDEPPSDFYTVLRPSEPPAPGSPTITYSIDSGDHYCERCHGFAQHCPALPIEQRLVIARKAVETARQVLEARKQVTALYDHEEEMLENAELWLSEVEEEVKPGRKEEVAAINEAACAAGNHDDYLCGPTRQMRCGNCGRHRAMQPAESIPAVHVPCPEHPKYGGSIEC